MIPAILSMPIKQFTQVLDPTTKYIVAYNFKAKLQLDNMHLMQILTENYKPMKMETNFRLKLLMRLSY